MAPDTPPTTPARYAAATAFWVLVGAMGAFGVAGLLTIGIFFLAGTAVLMVLALALHIDRRPAAAVLIGAGTIPLLLAWLNRSGPGTICERTPTSISCGEQYNPWPFVAVAVALVALGAILVIAARKRARRTPLADPPYPPIGPGEQQNL